MDHELALVMPVYNEEACVAQVVASWRDALSKLGIDFCMIVLNDGSKDGTARALEAFCADPHIEVVNKSNRGHGPTILMGYSMAVSRAHWVFQVDSDDEMKPCHFAGLWNNREKFDALFGIREGRVQNAGRKLISAVSRATVTLLFGRGIADVNVPYRLLRASLLAAIITQVPADTFAPNVIIAGCCARAGVRIFQMGVPHEGRKTGTISIVKWKLWKAVAKAFMQTLACRPKVPRETVASFVKNP